MKYCVSIIFCVSFPWVRLHHYLPWRCTTCPSQITFMFQMGINPFVLYFAFPLFLCVCVDENVDWWVSIFGIFFLPFCQLGFPYFSFPSGDNMEPPPTMYKYLGNPFLAEEFYFLVYEHWWGWRWDSTVVGEKMKMAKRMEMKWSN